MSTEGQERKNYAEWAHFQGGIVRIDGEDFTQAELTQILADMGGFFFEKGYRLAAVLKAGDKVADQTLEARLSAAEAEIETLRAKAALL